MPVAPVDALGAAKSLSRPVEVRLKQLKMRDFRAGSGFPLTIKRATIYTVPKGAIGRARFRAYIPKDPRRT
jgi:hypothetical protein